MAAMIAIAKHDIENIEEIVADLGDDKEFYPDLIRPLMSVYHYSTTSGQ